EASGFTDHHTRPEKIDIATSSGRGTVGVALKHINAFGCNIETLHQIRPQLLRMPFLSARFRAFLAPPINTVPPKCGEFREFAVDSVPVKNFVHVHLPITYEST